MASRTVFICFLCCLSSTSALNPGHNANPWETTWKTISAGPESPGWWEPFSLEALIKTKDAEADCWWADWEKHNVAFKLASKEQRTATLAIDQTGSDDVTQMLDSLALPDQAKVRRIEEDMMYNTDCTLKAVKNQSQRVIVVLRDPIERIKAGLVQHMGAHFHWIGHDANAARKAFNHNFKTINEYLDALRLTKSSNGVTSGLHKRAMAMTHCHNCMNFLLPVKGYYIRDGDAATDQDTKFVCACNLEEGVKRIAPSWGLKINMTATHERLSYRKEWKTPDDLAERPQAASISFDNLEWIKETYAEDIAFYQEHCSDTCNAKEQILFKKKAWISEHTSHLTASQ